MTIKGSKQVKIDHTFSLFSTSFEITGKPDGSEKEVLFLIRNPHLNLTVTQGDAHFPFCLLEDLLLISLILVGALYQERQGNSSGLAL